MIKFKFQCYNHLGGCSEVFIEESTRDAVDDLKPRCPKCNKRKSVGRDYSGTTFFGPTKTVGSRIDKNNSIISDDHAKHLDNKRLGKKDE